MVDLNNAVGWMVSIFPLIFNPSSISSNPLGNVPSALITIGINITHMFHSIFSSLVRFVFVYRFTFIFLLCEQSER